MAAHFGAEIDDFLRELKSRALPHPWLILLEGDLGVGKTTWTQEFVAALGGDAGQVKSPTFLKLLTHGVPAYGQVLHMDAYRVEDPDEFLRLGLESYENIGALVVEWPELFLEFLAAYPEYRRLLGIGRGAKLSFTLTGTGQREITREWF